MVWYVFLFLPRLLFGADFRPMAQDNHILFSQVFETVLKPLPKYDVDIVCRDSPTVKQKKIRNPQKRGGAFIIKSKTVPSNTTID